MTRFLFSSFLIALSSILASCDFNPTGLQVKSGWKSQSVAAWHDHRPDMMVFSKDGTWLYVSCENKASLLAPSLLRINMKTGQRETLVYGLHRADALKLAPDGSLWIGEEGDDGLIWRITEPDKLINEQRIDRFKQQASDPAIAPMQHAGRFSHEGLTFSRDGRFAYMADEWKEGCVYRYDMLTRKLYVMHETKGWLAIRDANAARLDAEKLHGQYFNRIEDMETLPDGRILMAETDTGRILALDDSGQKPQITTYLEHDNLIHPDNLAWDEKRSWLWITDDDKPSYLWAWDGKNLREIAKHHTAEITGITIHNDDVYINLQSSLNQTEVLLYITENKVLTP